MRNRRALVILSLFAATALSGCHTRARVSYSGRAQVRASAPTHVVVQSAPPPLEARVQVDARAPAPSADAVWVDGHYKWEGRWVWQAGHWETGHRGYVWVAPVAENRGGQIVYHPGYWCPEGEQPAAVYRQPGPVRVSVRPAGGAVVTATRPSGNVRVTATARPGTGGTTASTPTVTARPAGGGTTSASPPSGRATVTARAAGGGSTAATPPSRPTVTARAAGGGSTTATPPSQQPSGRTTVTARPAGGDVNRANATPPSQRSPTVTARSGANGSATRPSPSVSQNSGANGSATRPTPSQRGNANANASARAPQTRMGDATVDNPRDDGPQAQRVLRCSIDTPRAPRGGLITVSGTFNADVTVRIAGQVATIENRRNGQVRVRVPGSGGGGMVRVTEGSSNADCGNLSVTSR